MRPASLFCHRDGLAALATTMGKVFDVPTYSWSNVACACDAMEGAASRRAQRNGGNRRMTAVVSSSAGLDARLTDGAGRGSHRRLRLRGRFAGRARPLTPAPAAAADPAVQFMAKVGRELTAAARTRSPGVMSSVIQRYADVSYIGLFSLGTYRNQLDAARAQHLLLRHGQVHRAVCGHRGAEVHGGEGGMVRPEHPGRQRHHGGLQGDAGRRQHATTCAGCWCPTAAATKCATPWCSASG